MISLSLLSTPHRPHFQLRCVRSSRRCYPPFNLDMDRSHGFRVYVTRLYALLRLAFASAPPIGLTLPRNVTHRLIMQKVRGHTFRRSGIVLPLLVGTRFQILFHSPSGVLFTFPSRYSFTIGRQVVISLGRWSSQIPTGFHVSCGTRVFFARVFPFIYGAVTLYGRPFQTALLENTLVTRWESCRTPQRIPQLHCSNASTLDTAVG